MNNEQLLQSISDMLDEKLEQKLDQKLDQKLEILEERLEQKLDLKLDQKLDLKLQPIFLRLDVLEARQNHMAQKLNDFQLEVRYAIRDINKNIHKLQDEMETVIEILKMNQLIPQ